MSSTILTVIVLVVMWLVVLVPMVVRRPEEAARTAGREEAQPPPVPASRAAMMARRRRALGTLITLAAVTAVSAVLFSDRLWAAHAVCDLTLAGYLSWLRTEARRAAEVRQRRAARQTTAPSRRPVPVPADAAQTVVPDHTPSLTQLDEPYPHAVNG